MQEWILPALSIGSRVAPDAAGRVSSVYRQACNIELGTGALLTLLCAALGNLPHGIRFALPEAQDLRMRLRPGQAVVRDGARLRIAHAGVRIELSHAAPWRCELAACDVYARPAVQAMLAALAALRAHMQRGGFAPLVLSDAEPAAPLEQAMRRRLLDCLPLLDSAAANLDPALAMQALERLAGLGPGLTPSGDDFIVGYLASLHSRCQLDPVLRPFLNGLTAPLARLAAASNPISRQFILNAVDCEFAEALTQLVAAIAAHDQQGAREAAEQVASVGHSSGCDSLLGLLFGLHPSLVLGPAPSLLAGAGRHASHHAGESITTT
jgi:hypothetical protein